VTDRLETFTPEAFIEAAGWAGPKDPRSQEHPHQYTIRGRVTAGVEPRPPSMHDAMIERIAAHGTPGYFQGTRYVYLDVDGHAYWVSRGAYPPYYPIINRRRNDG
jgi:hypothetical protein